jgi:hypothetical protein
MAILCRGCSNPLHPQDVGWKTCPECFRARCESARLRRCVCGARIRRKPGGEIQIGNETACRRCLGRIKKT